MNVAHSLSGRLMQPPAKKKTNCGDTTCHELPVFFSKVARYIGAYARTKKKKTHTKGYPKNYGGTVVIRLHISIYTQLVVARLRIPIIRTHVTLDFY